MKLLDENEKIGEYNELCNKCIHKNLCENTRIYTGIDVYYCEEFTFVKEGDDK